MYLIKNTYESDRIALANQYVTAWRTKEAFERYDLLKKNVLEFAQRLEGEPHPVVKAKCFAYLTENAPIYINPNDWFGIAVEGAKLDPITDVGCRYDRPLLELKQKWMKEIDGKLNLPENEHFVRYTKNYLFNELYIDYNHSTPCWEDIFSLGISGMRERARKYRKGHEPLSDEKRAYFDGIDFFCCRISIMVCIDRIFKNARFIFHFVFTTYQCLFNYISTLIHYFCNQTR